MRTVAGKKALMGCLGLAAGVLLADVSQAACVQGDLTGTWHAVGIAGNIIGSYFDITNRCKVKLASTGTVVTSASGCTYNDWTGTGTSTISGGQLTTTSACLVHGTIRICESNSCTDMRVQFAQMARDKNTFDLLGYARSNTGFKYVFRFTKQ